MINTDYSSFRISKNSPAMKTKVWSFTYVSAWEIISSVNNGLVFWRSRIHIYPMVELLIFRNYSLLHCTSVTFHFAIKVSSQKIWNWIVWSWFRRSTVERSNHHTNSNPFVELFSLLIFWIQYILITSFQWQISIYFCRPDKLLFLLDPTHGKQIL